MTQPAPAHREQAPPRRPSWWAFLWWGTVGALVSFGVVSILSIGVFLLPVAVALGAGGMLWPPLRNRSVVAIVGGPAAAPFYLAWLNREGPGTVCDTLGDGVTTCAERWSPWPFLAVAAVLLTASVLAAARARRTG